MKIFQIILFLIAISSIFTNCINEANPSKQIVKMHYLQMKKIYFLIVVT